MARIKYIICVVLLLISLLLTVGTVLILRNGREQQPTAPSWDSLDDQTNGSTVQNTGSSVTDNPFETTQATEETTEVTTEPTTQPTTEETTVPVTTEQVATETGILVAKTAAEQIGKPYQYGTAGPDSFDTSGLVQYCFKQCGISLPRSNSALAETGYIVDKEDILPGDAVFFWSSTPGTAEYLGIYIGNGMVVAAMNASKPVVEFNMNSSYYTEHFVFVRRFY